jgi:ADP-ribose pyrophosphatase
MPFHDFIQDRDGWSTAADDVAFANPHLEIHRVTVTSPTRPEPFGWTVCHRKGAVVVAPMTEAGSFVLVRQERVPIRETIWEFLRDRSITVQSTMRGRSAPLACASCRRKAAMS